MDIVGLCPCAVFIVISLVFFATQVVNATPTKIALELSKKLLDQYDKKMKPTLEVEDAIVVNYSIEIYQILELNEPQQYVMLNAWIIEKWHDAILTWNPANFGNVTELFLPHSSVWIPDTTLYNSIIMKDDDTRRLLNVKLTYIKETKTTLVELLYPAVYKFSCLLNLRFFPFDTQICTMTVSSWTQGENSINYLYKIKNDTGKLGTKNYLQSEAWELICTHAEVKRTKFDCCEHPYALIKLTLYLRRKPLFYIVNLIIPTCIITLISIFGFFTASSASDVREEKVSLGITTMLSMSILMLMVSDQLPRVSTFIPLIGYFILSMIGLIAAAVTATTFIIAIQKSGRLGVRISHRAVNWATIISRLICVDIPLHLVPGTEEYEHSPSAFIASTRPEHYGAHRRSIMRHETPKMENVSSKRSSKNSENCLLFDPDLNANELHAPEILINSLPTVADIVDSEIVNNQKQHELKNSPNKTVLAKVVMRNAARMAKQVSYLTEQMAENRRLALIEFDWIASICERICFILCLLAFFILSIGINGLGYMHWLNQGTNLDPVHGQSESWNNKNETYNF